MRWWNLTILSVLGIIIEMSDKGRFFVDFSDKDFSNFLALAYHVQINIPLLCTFLGYTWKQKSYRVATEKEITNRFFCGLALTFFCIPGHVHHLVFMVATCEIPIGAMLIKAVFAGIKHFRHL